MTNISYEYLERLALSVQKKGDEILEMTLEEVAQNFDDRKTFYQVFRDPKVVLHLLKTISELKLNSDRYLKLREEVSGDSLKIQIQVSSENRDRPWTKIESGPNLDEVVDTL
jgi:hypothetical protein